MLPAAAKRNLSCERLEPDSHSFLIPLTGRLSCRHPSLPIPTTHEAGSKALPVQPESRDFYTKNSSSSGASLSVHFSSTTVYCKHWLGKVVCSYSRMISTGVCRSWSMCFCSHMCTIMPYMFASKNRHIFNCIGPSVQFCQT